MKISDTRVSYDLAEGEFTKRPMAVNYSDWKGIIEGFTGKATLELSATQFLKVLKGVIPFIDSNHSVVLTANVDLYIESTGEVGVYSWHIPR